MTETYAALLFLSAAADSAYTTTQSQPVSLKDGSWLVEVKMEGGSGRASVTSPSEVTVTDGQAVAEIIWSSPFYDYMRIGSTKYEPVNTEGNSTFEIPVMRFDQPIEVIADTTAMSTPHEITYTLTFDSGSAVSSGQDAELNNLLIYAAVGGLVFVCALYAVFRSQRKKR
jgi:hypothetical protein